MSAYNEMLRATEANETSPIQESEKYCINCKHVKENHLPEYQFIDYQCTYLRSPVTGLRKQTDCGFERSLAGHCKPEGINFIKRD